MDFKKILANFDAVETNTGVKGTKTKSSEPMFQILESLNRVTEAAKPDFADIDGDGDKKEPMKKAAKDKEKEKEAVEEAIMISAEGEEAESLLQILKLSGMPAPAPAALPVVAPAPEPEMGPMEPEIPMEDDYANSPDEFEQDVDSVIASGDDMHKEKDQFAAANLGDNPMKAFEGRFKAILADLLKED